MPTKLTPKIYSPRDWRHGRTSRFLCRTHHQSKSPRHLKNPKRPKAKKIFLLFKKFLPHLIFIVFIGILFLIGTFAWYSRSLPTPDRLLARDIAQSTKIYDRTGEHLLYEIHGEQKRTLVPLEKIPDYAIKATLALEDQHFYEHRGFSLWGTFRGVILSFFRGKRAQGGSTLTQQLVKNAILTSERSIKRKIKELILSYQLERKYTKNQILQMYFNEIPYGSTAYGIEAASYNYFNKSTKELTIAEAALLAALPQRPSYLSPYGSHIDELYGRQHYCLSQMAKLGYITAAEAEAAKNEKIVFKQKIEGITAPHFVFYVKELLSEKYGEKMIEQGGLKIISTLDFEMQKQAENIIIEQAEKNQKNFAASNAALVSLDISTGQILAMVGSKDFFDETIDGQVNVAISPRQPGSSFKPIVYTAAWQKGYVPETVIYDLETVFPSPQKDYFPHNYDLEERGPVSLRQALAGSLNIPAVKMIYLVGIDNVLNLAEKIGYTTLKDRSRFGLSLVLGGGEVKLLEHTNAFAVFGREGKFLPTAAILKIEDNNGRIIEEFHTQRGEKIMEPDIARITNDVLSDNDARTFIFGANNHLTLTNRPVTAKTGTTNDYRDAWTIGYTPSLATGVWVGNNDNSAMERGADGSVVAAPIWQKFMNEVLKDKPVETFIKPSYQISNKPMLGGDASGIKVKIDKISGLLATEETPTHLIEERLFKQVHNILHYLDKDDPLGPIPQNPENDPYYQYWEESVTKWTEEQGITNEIPPSQEDNIHRTDDKPQVTFVSPTDNQTISETQFHLEVSASARRGITRVEFYLGDNLLNTIYQGPYIINVDIPQNILNGNYQLKTKAYDDIENMGEVQISINLQRENYINITWVQPNISTTLDQTSFPYDLILYIEEIERVNKIDFYYRLVDDQQSNWLGFLDNVYDNLNQFTWSQPPGNGIYKIYPLITDYLGKAVTGPEITISIE
ncbi:PBP1A family penicillin-binding protein [Patescibacteria group bacterium]|nr:PBP1A family penicillin-binding protein [Patescibacteria group bacterium]